MAMPMPAVARRQYGNRLSGPSIIWTLGMTIPLPLLGRVDEVIE
jgi:hypothetical protein